MKLSPYHARKFTLLAVLLTSVAPVAFANPVDGVVAAGSASMASIGSTLTIHQTSDKAIIDWRGFDVGAGETTNFVQPTSHSLTINRVGSGGASQIDGNVTANGNIVIINPNGVVFGAGAHVDANSLIATTADVSNANAMAGKLDFNVAGKPNATIANYGTITAKDEGLVGLVAPNVINSGIITAKLGHIDLASGDTATVDLYGDGLIEVKASDALTHQLVENTGTLSAHGGTIAMTAAAGRETIDSLIHVGGTLDARGIGTHDGHIYIYDEGTSEGAAPGVSRVVVDGKLDVSNVTGKGGKVEVLADSITLTPTAVINADGKTGGGIVHIGGEMQGTGPTPTADEIMVAAGANITANALINGDGGEVVVYSSEQTEFDGRIAANGAGDQGDGGSVETSGRVALLINGGSVTATGRRRNGTWLLDPADVTINAAMAGTIDTSLNAGTNVTVDTSGVGGNGDITLVAGGAISTTGSGSLTLTAARNIKISDSITLQGGSLTLDADNANAGGSVVISSSTITTKGGNITIGGGNSGITGAALNADGSIATAATGFAVGDAASANGVSVSGTLDATGIGTGGTIIINGEGLNSTAANIGVNLSAATIKTNNAGSININGVAQGTVNAGSSYGVALVSTSSITNSGTGATIITGHGGGSGSGINNYGINATSSTVTVSKGTLNLVGTGGATNAASAVGDTGISLTSSTLTTSDVGAIDLVGFGGGTAGSTATNAVNFGINTTTSTISSTGTSGGGITLTGYNGYGTDNTVGIASSGTITSKDGLITVNGNTGISGYTAITVSGTGTTGASAHAVGAGIVLANGGKITGTGSAGITINAVSNNSGTSSVGVGLLFRGDGSTNAITTVNGDINITGTGGSGTGGNNVGVWVVSGGPDIIKTTGSGNITVKGIGGGGSSSYGINNGANGGIQTTGTGSISLYADSINFGSTSVNSITSLTIAPYTDIGMSIGTNVAGTLNIIDTQLTGLAAATFNFGAATTGNGTTSTGDLSVASAHDFANSNVTFFSGDDITVSSTFTKATGASTVNYNFNADRNVIFSSNAGIGTTTGAVNLTLNADDDSNGTGTIQFAGTTGAHLVTRTGNIVLNGNATTAEDVTLTTTTGNVTLNGTFDGTTNGTRNLTIADGTGTFTANGIIGGTHALNNLSITANDVAINADLDGTGTLTLQPSTTTRTIDIGVAGAGDFNLSSAEAAHLSGGWSGIIIGSTSDTGSMNIGTSSWADPVTFLDNSHKTLVSGSTLTSTSGAAISFGGGTSGWEEIDGNITADGALTLATDTYINANVALSTNNSAMNFDQLRIASGAAATLNAGTGTINFASDVMGASSGVAGGGLTATAKNITFASTLDALANLTATGTTTLSFAAALGGTTALGAVSLTNGGAITLPSIHAASIFAQTTGATSDITLANGTALTASGAGNAIVLASGRNFINSSGSATPFNLTGGGRWLVYSADPANNTRGGLLPDASDYNETYAGNAPATIGAGNRFIFSTATAPTITFATNDDHVTYGDAYTAADASTTYTSGLLGGDTLTTIGLTGANGLSTTYVQGTTDASATAYNGMITGTTGTLSSVLGYNFTFTSGKLTVDKRLLGFGLTGIISKGYDGTDSATLTSSNYNLTNVYGTDAIGVSATSGTYDDKNVNVGKTVTFNGLTLTGAQANDYSLPANTASGAIGTITQKNLTITANSQTIIDGASVPVDTITYSGFASGENAGSLSTDPTVVSAQSGMPTTGTYSGNYTVSGAVDGNYAISYVAGDLIVQPASSPTPPPASSIPDSVKVVSQDPATNSISYTTTNSGIASPASNTTQSGDDGHASSDHDTLVYKWDGTGSAGYLNLHNLISIAPSLQEQLGMHSQPL